MKYYSLERIKAKDAQYNFIYGGRASGKSYDMARELLDNFIERGEQFVRIVRNSLHKTGIETYFDEVILNNPDKYAGLAIDFDGQTYRIGKEIFGYAIPLTLEQTRKSNQFPKVTTCVFEEFVCFDITDYIESETEHFKSLISTVFRHRKGKVYFIGNSVTQSNPYFDLFKVDPTQLAVGDLKYYELMVMLGGKEAQGASVAIEYVPIGYDTVDEVPTMLRIPDNEIAFTGAIVESEDITDKIVTIFNESGNPIGYAIKGYSPSCIRCIRWQFEEHAFQIMQTQQGDIWVTEMRDYDSSMAKSKVKLAFREPTPEGIISSGVPMNSPDITECTGAATQRIWCDCTSTEYYFNQCVSKYRNRMHRIRNLGFTHGYDMSTAEGRAKQQEYEFDRSKNGLRVDAGHCWASSKYPDDYYTKYEDTATDAVTDTATDTDTDTDASAEGAAEDAAVFEAEGAATFEADDAAVFEARYEALEPKHKDLDKTIASACRELGISTGAPRKRGRPKGSKNKPKTGTGSRRKAASLPKPR